jgi:transcriptional regulator with XRE-family HTH domain
VVGIRAGMAVADVRTPDGVRRYFKQLREEAGYSQEQLAELIGMSLRAWIDWENGTTGDIKSVLLFRAIDALSGSLPLVQALMRGSEEVDAVFSVGALGSGIEAAGSYARSIRIMDLSDRDLVSVIAQASDLLQSRTEKSRPGGRRRKGWLGRRNAAKDDPAPEGADTQ